MPMRLVIAGLLIVGGGLAALALVWVFYSTADTDPPATASVVTSEQTGSPAEPVEAKTDQTGAAADPSSLQIEVARIGPDGSAVFAGRGSPGADVMIFEQDKVLAQATVTADGEWVAVAEEPLRTGEHLIIAEMKTADDEIHRADQAIIADLDASGQDTPLVALVPMTEQAEVELIQAPEAFASRPETPAGQSVAELGAVLVEPAYLAVSTLSWADQDVLQIKGRSSGGQSVHGTLNDRAFAARHNGDSGDWTAALTIGGMSGKAARLTGHLLNADNQIIASHQLDFNLDQLDIGRDGSEMVIIEKGDMLWRIAYRTFGNGIRYLDIVRRNQDRIADPDLIYPAQVFALPE